MKKALSIIFVFVLLISLCSCASSTDSQKQQSGVHPQKQKQDYETAMRYMKQGKYEEAISSFNALGDYADAADQAKYCEAQSYCYIGDYQSAYDILIQIPELEGVKALLREIFFETRLFEGLSDLRKVLKNPDSLTLTSVQFTYNSTSSSASWTKENPPCIVTASAQNGFGGYSFSYVLFTEEKGSNIYKYYGSCKSLDYSDYSSSDDLAEGLVAAVINTQLENTPVNNPINIDRVNNIIKLQKYSNITRISGQNYADIDY